jgi:small neutral amino acid transporter SnatA (MarC family)
VAALIIAVFVLFGQQILLYLGIRLPSMEAPGGLLLLWSHSTCFAARPRPVRRELGQHRLRTERVGVELGLADVLALLWLTLRFAGVVRRCSGSPASSS